MESCSERQTRYFWPRRLRGEDGNCTRLSHPTIRPRSVNSVADRGRGCAEEINGALLWDIGNVRRAFLSETAVVMPSVQWRCLVGDNAKPSS